MVVEHDWEVLGLKVDRDGFKYLEVRFPGYYNREEGTPYTTRHYPQALGLPPIIKDPDLDSYPSCPFLEGAACYNWG